MWVLSTCGEPNEIKKDARLKKITFSFWLALGDVLDDGEALDEGQRPRPLGS